MNRLFVVIFLILLSCDSHAPKLTMIDTLDLIKNGDSIAVKLDYEDIGKDITQLCASIRCATESPFFCKTVSEMNEEKEVYYWSMTINCQEGNSADLIVYVIDSKGNKSNYIGQQIDLEGI